MIPLNPKTLLAFQILAHISIIPLVIFGEWWHWLVVFVVYFFTGCLGMVMTYHRLLSHRCWFPPKWIEYLFTLFATVGLTGSAIAWVAIHHEHHKFSDTERDPHSPKYKGMLWSHFLSMFAPVKPKYSASLIRNKFYQFQHKHYLDINVVYGMILYLIDPMAVLYAWLVPAAVLWNLGSLIISASHRDDKVHDDLLFALTTWGDGYHAVHHKYPGRVFLGTFDTAGWVIRALGMNKKNKRK